MDGTWQKSGASRAISEPAKLAVRSAFFRGQPLQNVKVASSTDLARLAALPGSGIQRIDIPAGPERVSFLKNWARRGVGSAAALFLILPLAAMAQAAGFVAANSLEGVTGVGLNSDGSATIQLSNGQAVTVAAESVQVAASGEILISAAAAEGVVAAAAAVAGLGAGALAGLAGIGAAGAIGAGSGGGGDDGDEVVAGSEDPDVVVVPPPRLLKVSDGYIADALVFRDFDGDGIHDEGVEPSTRTDEDGDFDVNLLPGTGRLVARGGIDVSTGEAFRGIMTAPEDSGVITPLTTLVQAFVEAEAQEGRSVSAAEAATTLGAKLGLAGVNLLSVDPVASADSAATAEETSALAKAAQIANTLIVASAAGADSETVARSLAQSVASAEGQAVLLREI